MRGAPEAPKGKINLYRQGANYQDQNAIKRLAAEGMSAEQISKQLRIVVPMVEKFMPEANRPAPDDLDEMLGESSKPPPKPKAKRK